MKAITHDYLAFKGRLQAETNPFRKLDLIGKRLAELSGAQGAITTWLSSSPDVPVENLNDLETVAVQIGELAFELTYAGYEASNYRADSERKREPVKEFVEAREGSGALTQETASEAATNENAPGCVCDTVSSVDADTASRAGLLK